MNGYTSLELLKRSIEASSRYPKNLMRTGEFPHDLERYHSTITSSEKGIFRPAGHGCVVFWDMDPSKDGGYRYTEVPVKGLDELGTMLAPAKPDPFKRFIFLRSRSFRSPLNCSRSQMQTILSSHQVMASFLDHVISFKRREEPYGLASFTSEDYLSSHHKLPSLADMNRSGVQLQHCFNVLRMEKNDTNNWKQHQVAAYHSLDFQQGRSTWIVMKADDRIRERLQEVTSLALEQRPEYPASLASAFQESLRDHHVILQWGTENWSQYIDALEEEYAHAARILSKFKKIDALTDDIFTGSGQTRVLPHIPRPANFVTTDPNTAPYDLEKAMTAIGDARASGVPQESMIINTRPDKLRPAAQIPKQAQSGRIKGGNQDADLTDLFKFQNRQRLHTLATNTHAATSAIRQNIQVFRHIRNRYWELSSSSFFRLRVPEEGTRRLCEQHTSDLTRRVLRLESELNNHVVRLQNILYRTEQAIDMYKCMFHVVKTTAEYFAKATPETSFDVFQREGMNQMHQKTKTMHIITVFTLIFLPGTFAATLFSSGIFTFGDEGTGSVQRPLDERRVRMKGIKLFFAICVPLLFVTVSIWAVVFYTSRATNRRTRRVAAARGVP